MSRLRTYLLTGLLVLVPLAITVWVLSLVVGTMDRVFTILPNAWQPRVLLGFDVPGLGVIAVVLLVLVVGVLTHNFIGKQVVDAWNSLLNRIPVVRGIYNSVKQVSDTLFSESGNAFREAVLVQYPRPGAWTIAFVTGKPGGEVAEHLQGEHVSVYVPTTPNPTSGFFLMMPKADVVELNMSVDEALKYVISMGVVVPQPNARSGARADARRAAQDVGEQDNPRNQQG
ncbi:MAG: DUF502 domain-containing protein [Betaproteobacteria bacterium]|nr:DUF502 domain-containing protein [Betaproteobacteria bacterium]